MNKFGGGGLVIAGIIFVVVGALLRSGFLEFLLDILGFIVIAAGIAIGVYGLVKMFSGSKDGASNY